MVVLIILSLLVILHEIGHLAAAWWLKLRVEEFGLGYPPRARKLFTWKGTDFTLNWIPFGGFVRLWGEEAGDENSSQAFARRPVWQRLIVMLAGPGINFLAALILFGLVFSIGGLPRSLKEIPRVNSVVVDSPAAQAGILPHDNLVGFLPTTASSAAELISVTKISQVQEFVQAHRGETWTVKLQGPCQKLECTADFREATLYLRTAAETPSDQGAMGIAFREYELEFFPWYQMPFRGMWFGLQQTIELTGLMLGELRTIVVKLVSGQGVSSSVAGPIGIVHQAEQTGIARGGWLTLLNFAAVISLNLAVMNILPIPALDGGRATLALAELVVGKRRVDRVEGYVNYGGFILLLSLLVLISFRDVWQIWISR